MKKFLFLFLFLIFNIACHGQFVVTISGDNGVATLRNAIELSAPGGTITFGSNMEINLSEQLLVDKPLTINAGNKNVIVSAGPDFPDEQHIFVIASDNVTIKGLEISGATGKNGQECGEEIEEGGIGIFVREGNVKPVIEDCNIHSNASHGVYFEGGNINGIISNCVISNNCNNGVQIDNFSPGAQVINNRIGTNPNGDEEFGNYWDGLVIERGSNGFLVEGNLVSGNGKNVPTLDEPADRGIRINNCRGGIIRNNLVGTDITGYHEIGNARHGIFLHSVYEEVNNQPLSTENILIDGNVVSGNGKLAGAEGHGINLADEHTLNNTIRGNIVGLDIDGDEPIPNKNDGISLFWSSGNIIGGENPDDRNIISGNNFGVFIQSSSNDNVVRNNYIGTNIDGTEARPNAESGVIIQGGYYTWINWDGAPSMDRPSVGNEITENVISGNTLNGVVIQNGVFNNDGIDYPSEEPTTDNLVKDNIIGLQSDGLSPLPNGEHGLFITDRTSGNSVLGNTICFNGMDGIAITDEAFDNQVSGNYIGVNKNLEAAPNRRDGIRIQEADNNLIGELAGNNISANSNNGISILNGSGNEIMNNEIGGEGIGNGMNGILIVENSEGNIIGDSWANKNTISHNAENAIAILEPESRINPIRQNSIFCNGYGILLAGTGNDFYSMPLEKAVVDFEEDELIGEAAANSVIEVFKVNPACDDCQGWQFMGEAIAAADGSWLFNIPGADEDDKFVFTATEPGGGARNTSEFSPCSVLPVELLAFDAEIYNEYVKLEWTTATEKNNDKFEVQYSKNGLDFEEIGVVEGAGTTSYPVFYSFEHKTVPSGNAFYRLKQIDYDGTAAYSPVRMVRIKEIFSWIAYPNPVSGVLNLKGQAEGTLKVEIKNILGKSVHTKEVISNGALSLQITVDYLPTGVYLLIVYEEGEEPVTLRFVKN